ncbi:MAG TPA: hypothetical protein VII36_08150, partial [Usitatibacter sp.]
MNIKRSVTLACAVLAVGTTMAIDARAACHECGTVTDVQTITKEGEGSGLGMVLGGVAGGVLGHQV